MLGLTTLVVPPPSASDGTMAVISPNVCTSTASGEINSLPLLVPVMVNILDAWNEK